MYPLGWDDPNQQFESTLPLAFVSIPSHRCLADLHAAATENLWSLWRVSAHQ